MKTAREITDELFYDFIKSRFTYGNNGTIEKVIKQTQIDVLEWAARQVGLSDTSNRIEAKIAELKK